MFEFKIYSDGASRGNPGHAGAGAVILDSDGNQVDEICKYLGETTNNQAEYQALLLALEKASKLKPESIEIYADSELMIKQLKGEYKMKNEALKPHFQKIMTILNQLKKYKLTHVPREKNKKADKLANEAIDGRC